MFTAEAWRIATGPIMAPGYLCIGDGRVMSVGCERNPWDGGLLADIVVAVPRPDALAGVRGYGGWQIDARGTYQGPTDEALSRRGAMLTTTRLLIPISAGELVTPLEAPGVLAVSDAKAAVRRLAKLLNERIIPIFAAFD